MSYDYSKPESDGQYRPMSLSVIFFSFLLYWMICVEIQTACHGEHMCAQPQSLCIFLDYAAPTCQATTHVNPDDIL